jgi:hypothetical protein
VTDSVASARDVIARAEARLLDVRKARVALAAAGERTGDAEAEIAVCATMLATFERGLLAALDADLQEAARKLAGTIPGIVAAGGIDSASVTPRSS